MSKLKISNNLFLEVNELNALVKCLEEDGYKRLFKSIVNNYGVVKDKNNSYFKVSNKPGSNEHIIINKGLAYDTNLNAILLNEDLEIQISGKDVPQWVVISRNTNNIEIGSVAITRDGNMTGSGTKFTEVLRGQPNFPTKVKLTSEKNSGEYEVVNVLSDTSALLSGTFTAESDLNYSVIGTFTPGFQPSEYDKYIYEYDSCSIRMIDSDSRPEVGEDEFIIAKIEKKSGGILNVYDERIKSYFDNPYQGEIDDNISFVKNIVNLNRASVVSNSVYGTKSAEFELILEHGYTINKYEITSTSASDSLEIVSGNNNYLGDEIPDGMFDGWNILNRDNMKSVGISYNVGNKVILDSFDEDVFNNVSKLIIIPNARNIEYEVKLSSNTTDPEVPFLFSRTITESKTRVMFRVMFEGEDEVTVSMRYRLVGDGRDMPFKQLSLAKYINIDEQEETLSKSSFDINIAKLRPQKQKRNYS